MSNEFTHKPIQYIQHSPLTNFFHPPHQPDKTLICPHTTPPIHPPINPPSGQIDKNEFRALLRNLSLRYSNERYRKLFRAIDRDGGGTIDKSEYFKLLFPDEEYTEVRVCAWAAPSLFV